MCEFVYVYAEVSPAVARQSGGINNMKERLWL